MERTESSALFPKQDDTDENIFSTVSWKNPTYRRKLFRTFWIWWACFMFGWVYEQMGAALPDLQLLLDIDLHTASWLLTSTSLGYLAGGYLQMLIDVKISATLLLSIYSLGTAVFTVALPWCPLLWLMLVERSLTGVCLGGLDTATHADLFFIWRLQTATYIQMMNFSFGFGGMVAPFITKYFIAPETDLLNMTLPNTNYRGSSVLQSKSASDQLINTTFQSQSVHALNLNDNANALQNRNITHTIDITRHAQPETRIQWAFLISGIIALITATGNLYTFTNSKIEAVAETVKPTKEHKRKRPSKPVFVIVIIILCSIMYLASGWIDCFALYLTTFCLRELDWSKESSVLAASVYWLAFCSTCFFNMILHRCINTEKLILQYLSSSVIAFFLLLISSYYKINPLSWISIALTGISMSILRPAMFVWTEETVMEISNKVAFLYNTACGIGSMLNPLLLGFLMDYLAGSWFIYLLMGEGLVILGAFTVIVIIYRQLGPPAINSKEEM